MNSLANTRILFISHDASRTGAPFCLLHLVRWLQDHSDVSVEILLRNEGPLVEEFAQLGPVHVWREPVPMSRLVKERGLRRAIKPWLRQHFPKHRSTAGMARGLRGPQLLAHVQHYRPTLIYSNTVVNGDLLRILAPVGCPVLSHIHELRSIIEMFGPNNWKSVSKHTDQFIAASPSVKRNLVENYGVAAKAIDVVYESIPTQNHPRTLPDPQLVRQQLEIPDEDFIVCGSGTDAWRKGTDLFIQVANVVTRHRHHSASFVWVGGWLSKEEREKHLRLANELGVASRIKFTGMVDNPLDYFAAANAFALTSREDPFPLVCLEAASLGKPVLCFAESGGMPDFVENDAGFVVPKDDIEAMAARIIHLIEHPNTAKSLGERAQRKVRERHDVDVGAHQILQVIERLLGSREPQGRA